MWLAKHSGNSGSAAARCLFTKIRADAAGTQARPKTGKKHAVTAIQLTGAAWEYLGKQMNGLRSRRNLRGEMQRPKSCGNTSARGLRRGVQTAVALQLKYTRSDLWHLFSSKRCNVKLCISGFFAYLGIVQ